MTRDAIYSRVSTDNLAPLLNFLLSTGARRGEAMGLRWEDVDFERSRVSIRRALTRGQAVTPKSGKARTLAMPPSLTAALAALLRQRREECLKRKWPEVPPWVFCSFTRGPLEERNVERSWYRLRRIAQGKKVRPLRLHARHTFASLALAAGRSIRWVAEQLGHANPELTLRVYAHALPVTEADLAFADFGGAPSAPERRSTAPDGTSVSAIAEATKAAGGAITLTRGGASRIHGARDGNRTRDPRLGKPMLYQLSYSRV